MTTRRRSWCSRPRPASRSRTPGSTRRPAARRGSWHGSSSSRSASASRRSCTTAWSSRSSRWAWGCRAPRRCPRIRSSLGASRAPPKRSTAPSGTCATTSSGFVRASWPTGSSIRHCEQLAAEFQDRTEVLTIVEVDGAVAAELASRAADVVQIVREALSNVGRHAEATSCRVSLRRTDGGAELEIDDDGRGFDPEAPSSGMGMRNLRERVTAPRRRAGRRERGGAGHDDPGAVARVATARSGVESRRRSPGVRLSRLGRPRSRAGPGGLTSSGPPSLTPGGGSGDTGAHVRPILR